MKIPTLYLALAEAAEGAPQAAEQQLLDIDWTVFLTLGIFLIAVAVLTRFLWKPYLRVREERVTRVEGYREDAKRLESEAAVRLAKVEAELAEARRAGALERARVRTEGQRREQEIISAAQSSAQKTVAESRARIEAALAKEQATLKARAELLGRQAAEKVLGRGVA